MKKVLIVIVLLAVGAGIWWYVLDNQPAVMTSLPDNTKIYDVRTLDEYAISHVSSAELLPITDLRAGALPAVDKNSWIAVYCRSGNRSKEAVDILKKAGFTKVIDIGGLDDISKYGLSVVK